METLVVAISVLIFAGPALLLLGYGGWLSIHDLRTHRLPNLHVGLLTTLLVVVELLISWSTGSWVTLASSLKVSLATTAVYFGLYLVSRRQIGMGDVKYALPTGLVLGFYAPQSWLPCIFATFCLAGAVSLIGMLTGRLERSSRIAFGPYMTIATLIFVLIQGVNSP